MKVLLVGSGGREHAIIWKLAQSPKVDKIYCAPGNAGIAMDAECVNIKAEDIDGVVAFAKENAIDMAVIGPEVPLARGIVDALEAEGVKTFALTRSVHSWKQVRLSLRASWLDTISRQQDTKNILIRKICWQTLVSSDTQWF